MAGYVILGMLAAFGTLCAGWLICGLLLPRSRGTLLVLGEDRTSLLRRCLWLREMGILDAEIVLFDPMPETLEWPKVQGVEIWDASCLRKLVGTGAEENGTGTGDPPGCHQCGGVSEL